MPESENHLDNPGDGHEDFGGWGQAEWQNQELEESTLPAKPHVLACRRM
jgi:hypothetical protein